MVTTLENLRRTHAHHSRIHIVVCGIEIPKPNNYMQIAFTILLREQSHWNNKLKHPCLHWRENH